MKITSIILLCLLLLGCTVYTYSAASNSYLGLALRFQTQGVIGHTDPEQRMQAFITCGLPANKYNDGLDYIHRMRSMHGYEEPLESRNARTSAFRQCMKEKGYTLLTEEECGSEKENKQICK